MVNNTRHSSVIPPMMSVREATALTKLFEACTDPKLRREVLTLVPELADMVDLGYRLSIDGKAITCLRCGLTSHNANDVANRYCGHCHVFHRFHEPGEDDPL